MCLFPRESCSCPPRTSCYHITAARLAVGLSDSGTWCPLNLTQLRRNKRRRMDGSVRGPAISCPQVTSTRIWHHHGKPAAAAATISNSCGRGTKQLAGAKFTYRQRRTTTSTTMPESALTVVMTICRGASTKALGHSRGSSTGYSVTPAASGCTTSARALDALAASN